MLAHDAPAEIFHPNLQAPTANGAFLHEERWVGHDGASCRQTAIRRARVQLSQQLEYCQFQTTRDAW
jgi:hypothetical protein